MKKSISLLLMGAALLGCINSPKSASTLKEIGTMPSFERGYEQGVSACYAAVHNDTLYIAGGCNFPETPAAQGGSKRYYKGIYKAAIGDTLHWETAGTLPTASAYGASTQYGSLLIIVGGMNTDEALTTVLSIDMANGCKSDTLPSLPCSIENCAGAISQDLLFVTGGNCNGKPSNRTFMLNLGDSIKRWEELPPMPSRARVQPVCAATNDALYVWGGFTPSDSTGGAHTHTDGVCYNINEKRWTALPDVTDNDTPVSLSGGTAILATDECNIVAAGGVNSEIFTDAISGRYQLIKKEDYMHQKPEWYRFNPRLMLYNTTNGKWETVERNTSFARAGAIMVRHNDNIIYIGGELKPGIRTPQIHIR